MQRCRKNGGGYWNVLKKRYFKLLPFTTFAYIIQFAVCRIIIAYYNGEKINILQYINLLISDFGEIILVKMNGMNANVNDTNGFFNQPIWFISALLISEFIIICVLSYWKELFYNLVCPLMILFGIGSWYHMSKFGNGVWLGFITYGVFRILVTICISYYAFRFSKYLENIKFTNIGLILITEIEFLCFILTSVIFMSHSKRIYTISAICLMALGCAITKSQKSFINNWIKDSKVTKWLGKLSMSIYLIQGTVLSTFSFLYPNNYLRYSNKNIFIISLIIMSGIFCLSMQIIMKYIAKIKQSFVSVMIKT